MPNNKRRADHAARHACDPDNDDGKPLVAIDGKTGGPVYTQPKNVGDERSGFAPSAQASRAAKSGVCRYGRERFRDHGQCDRQETLRGVPQALTSVLRYSQSRS